jgi:hypothetical protein
MLATLEVCGDENVVLSLSANEEARSDDKDLIVIRLQTGSFGAYTNTVSVGGTQIAQSTAPAGLSSWFRVPIYVQVSPSGSVVVGRGFMLGTNVLVAAQVDFATVARPTFLGLGSAPGDGGRDVAAVRYWHVRVTDQDNVAAHHVWAVRFLFFLFFSKACIA